MKKSYQLKNKYNNIVLLNFANPRAAFRYLKNKYQKPKKNNPLPLRK